jgi:hypothetical protein
MTRGTAASAIICIRSPLGPCNHASPPSVQNFACIPKFMLDVKIMPYVFFLSIPVGLAIELTKFPSHDTHPIRAVNTADSLLKAGLVADT